MMNDPSNSIYGWIAHLANAVVGLNGEQLRILASSYRGENPAPSLSSLQLQRILSLSTADAANLARKLKQFVTVPDVTARDIGIALATLTGAWSGDDEKKERVEVVCTAPSRLGVPLRTTFATAVEMVKAARREVIVVGYVFTEGATALVSELADARRKHGVHVTFIGNRLQNQLSVLRSMWPSECPAPYIFSREADREDDMAALHAKLLICDSTTALVTSANFSYHGLHENIEVGVKIQAASVARLVEFIRAMIQMKEVGKIEWISELR